MFQATRNIARKYGARVLGAGASVVGGVKAACAAAPTSVVDLATQVSYTDATTGGLTALGAAITLSVLIGGGFLVWRIARRGARG